MSGNDAATKYVPCPKCGSTDVKQVGYTWWGGFLGSKLMHHVKCNACSATYNGKTGKPNTMKIAIYMIVVGALIIALWDILDL